MHEQVPDAADILLTLETIEDLDILLAIDGFLDWAVWITEFEPLKPKRWEVNNYSAFYWDEGVQFRSGTVVISPYFLPLTLIIKISSCSYVQISTSST